MAKTIINTKNAPAPVGAYSQGTTMDKLIFTAGQIPLNPENGEFLNDDIELATRMVLKNMLAVVKAGGGSKESILKVTVFMVDLNDFAVVNTVFSEFFPENPPARSAVQVAALPKNALIEMECIAYKNLT